MRLLRTEAKGFTLQPFNRDKGVGLKYMKKGEGFTLIELLVVIAIIGLLSTIVLVSLNTARQKARDSRRVADLRQIAVALEMYYDDNRAYPGDSDGTSCDDWTAMQSALEGATPSYMAKVPNDPLGGTVVYRYNAAGTPINTYVLQAQLEQASATGPLLSNDVDGSPLGCPCNDASRYYCIKP